MTTDKPVDQMSDLLSTLEEIQRSRPESDSVHLSIGDQLVLLRDVQERMQAQLIHHDRLIAQLSDVIALLHKGRE